MDIIVTAMLQARGKKVPIAGYMGYMPSSEGTEQVSEPYTILGQSQIPGYVGYIPAVKSQNLYAKTYGKITENCSKGNYHKGIESPPEVKYLSTTKETYVHPNSIKINELNDGKINGVKMSTFSNAGKWIIDGSANKQFQPQTHSTLTYEQACQKAYK